MAADNGNTGEGEGIRVGSRAGWKHRGARVAGPAVTEGRPQAVPAAEAPAADAASPSTRTQPQPAAPQAPPKRHPQKKERKRRSGHQKVAPEQAKRACHVPDGPVPTSGLRGKLWEGPGSRLYARYGWQRLTNLSWSDRDKVADNLLWQHRETQLTFTGLNTDGASCKTQSMAWLAGQASLSIYPSIIIDVNEAPGATAKRFGIEPDSTLMLRDYVRDYERITGSSDLLRRAKWQEQTGVVVIASERNSREMFDVDHAERALRHLKSMGHSLFCDAGNPVSAWGNLAAIRVADQLIFPGNVNKPDSLDTLPATQQLYRTVEEGVHADKVEQGIIIVFGGKLSRREHYAKRYEWPIERVFVIPRNDYMFHTKPVDFDKIPLEISVILKEILVLAYSGQPANRQAAGL